MEKGHSDLKSCHLIIPLLFPLPLPLPPWEPCTPSCHRVTLTWLWLPWELPALPHHHPRSCHHALTVTATHLLAPPCSCHCHLRALSSWQPCVIFTWDAGSASSLDPRHLNSVRLSLPPEGPITRQPIQVPLPLPLHIPRSLPGISRLSNQRPETPGGRGRHVKDSPGRLRRGRGRGHGRFL